MPDKKLNDLLNKIETRKRLENVEFSPVSSGTEMLEKDQSKTVNMPNTNITNSGFITKIKVS